MMVKITKPDLELGTNPPPQIHLASQPHLGVTAHKGLLGGQDGMQFFVDIPYYKVSRGHPLSWFSAYLQYFHWYIMIHNTVYHDAQYWYLIPMNMSYHPQWFYTMNCNFLCISSCCLHMLSASPPRCSFQLDLQVCRNLMSDPWWDSEGGDAGIPTQNELQSLWKLVGGWPTPLKTMS